MLQILKVHTLLQRFLERTLDECIITLSLLLMVSIRNTQVVFMEDKRTCKCILFPGGDVHSGSE